MAKNINRHLEISAKLIELGNALMKEGNDKKDYYIVQTGTFIVLIGGILFSEEDVKSFAQICGMFSAKKILDSIDNDDLVSGYLNKKNKMESYDDFIKRINKLKDDNKDELLD